MRKPRSTISHRLCSMQRQGVAGGYAPGREDQNLVEDDDSGRSNVANVSSLLDHLVERLGLALPLLSVHLALVLAAAAVARHARHVEAHLDELVDRSLEAGLVGRRGNLERNLGSAGDVGVGDLLKRQEERLLLSDEESEIWACADVQCVRRELFSTESSSRSSRQV